MPRYSYRLETALLWGRASTVIVEGVTRMKKQNIAGRLPENSRNSFVDLQSQKNSKEDRPKKFVFSLKADMLYFD